jgi:hypothetical protein
MASTSIADTVRSITLPTFDGEQKSFQLWWTRFKAYAAVKKFAKAIQRTAETSLPTVEATSTSTTAAQLAALERNRLAVATLTMAFQTGSLMSLMYKAESSSWPSGRAYMVIDLLFKKYRPVDTISKVELRQRFNQINMKTNQDPKLLFDQIAAVENAYNSTGQSIDEEELIATMAEN